MRHTDVAVKVTVTIPGVSVVMSILAVSHLAGRIDRQTD